MSQNIIQANSIFQHVFNSSAFTILSFNSCDYNNGNFRFYQSGFHYIKELNVSKFGAINVINVCPYQDYLDVLKDLILVKKVVITCAYPIISIIKLRSSDRSFMTSYHQTRSHIVVLP